MSEELLTPTLSRFESSHFKFTNASGLWPFLPFCILWDQISVWTQVRMRMNQTNSYLNTLHFFFCLVCFSSTRWGVELTTIKEFSYYPDYLQVDVDYV